MNNQDAIGQFFRAHGASAVGDTMTQPLLPGLGEEGAPEEGAATVEWGVETPPENWTARTIGEAPAKEGEYPIRFIDGSLLTLPVLCLRAPEGWPIPLLAS